MRIVLSANSYNGYALSQTNKNCQGFYVEILRALDALFTYMMDRHSKVYFIRFDLRYPAGLCEYCSNDNTRFSKFMDALVHHCQRRNYDPKYLWVREKSGKTGQYHYHVVLLLNGHPINNGFGIREKVKLLWRGGVGLGDGKGLVYFEERYGHDGDPDYQCGGVLIRRAKIGSDSNGQSALEYCYQLASYLAKCYSKGDAPAYKNEFGCSRIPSLKKP